MREADAFKKAAATFGVSLSLFSSQSGTFHALSTCKNLVDPTGQSTTSLLHASLCLCVQLHFKANPDAYDLPAVQAALLVREKLNYLRSAEEVLRIPLVCGVHEAAKLYAYFSAPPVLFPDTPLIGSLLEDLSKSWEKCHIALACVLLAFIQSDASKALLTEEIINPHEYPIFNFSDCHFSGIAFSVEKGIGSFYTYGLAWKAKSNGDFFLCAPPPVVVPYLICASEGFDITAYSEDVLDTALKLWSESSGVDNPFYYFVDTLRTAELL